jgi:ERF superfamily
MPGELSERSDQLPAESRPANAWAILQQAVQSNMSIDTIERLTALCERADAREAEHKFADAIAEFQRRCPQVKKRRVVEKRATKSGAMYGGYAYASLDDVDKVARPFLNELGISHSFDTKRKADNIDVTIRLRVGSYFEDRTYECPIPRELSASEPQKWAAAVSFAKRIAFCSSLGIVVTDEDDDAASVIATISATQLVEMEALIQQTGTDIDRLLKYLGVESLDLCPAIKYGDAMSMLQRKAQQGAKP